MQTRLSAFLTLPLVMLLGGCPVWGGSDGPATGDATCRTHGDCAVGSYCETSADACVDSNECTNDGDCTASQNCDYRGTCVPDVAGACRSDGDCTTGNVCIEGFCRTVGIETCQFDLECAGRACVDSVCTPPCTTATDCGSGQTCTSGLCVATPGECVLSDDCSGSEHCVDGRCFADCEGSASCNDSDDACSADGFCRPDWEQSGFCNSDAQCAVGSTCELSTGVCRIVCTAASPLVTGYSGAGCGVGFTNADCACQSADTQFPTCGVSSDPSNDDYCRTVGEQMSDCETKSDCGAAQHCVDGTCE